MKILLRKLELKDTDQLVKLADNRNISDDMCTLPVPFARADAELIISRSQGTEEVIMGIIEDATQTLTGVVMIRDIEPCHEQAELSIWIGKPFWGKGYATQAIQQMSDLGYSSHGLNRIYAFCMVRNIASQRILEKSGFTREGLLRSRVIKNGKYEDVYLFARLKND